MTITIRDGIKSNHPMAMVAFIQHPKYSSMFIIRDWPNNKMSWKIISRFTLVVLDGSILIWEDQMHQDLFSRGY